MRAVLVLYKDEEAGILTQMDDGSFTYQYHAEWVADPTRPSISLTLPKREELYLSPYLFAFFYNMLPEGSNKRIVCQHHKIDLDDYFSLLMITAQYDTIGAVRIEKVDHISTPKNNL